MEENHNQKEGFEGFTIEDIETQFTNLAKELKNGGLVIKSLLAKDEHELYEEYLLQLDNFRKNKDNDLNSLSKDLILNQAEFFNLANETKIKLIEELQSFQEIPLSGDQLTAVSKTEKPRYFRDYNPTVMDFLARAKTEEECEEIISYCLSKDDITEDEASDLRLKLAKGGPNAFGSREYGYYLSKL